MKIGIFTFHCAANYGAVLQTYCLQEVLKDMGHEVHIIDYRPKFLIEPYKAFFYDSTSLGSKLAKCKGFLRACLVAPIRWKRNRAFSRFVHDYINLYQLDLNDVSNDFDAFVFGSDQIWNPKLTNGFDKVYLGDFPAAKGKKLIAYAASAGSISNFNGEDTDYFLSRLQYFDKVTVREKSLAEYINSKVSHIAEIVLDPVMLGGIPILNTLLSLGHLKKYNKPYLLLFQLNRDDRIAKYSINMANKKGLDIVELATSAESLFNRKMKQTLSVEDVLCLFKNSSYVITASFHGTVLALLCKKQFYTISKTKGLDERALFMLKELGLSNRMIALNEIGNDDIIDYSMVENIRKEKIIEIKKILRDI